MVHVKHFSHASSILEDTNFKGLLDVIPDIIYLVLKHAAMIITHQPVHNESLGLI